jgi:hypothetical protein
MPSTEEPAVSLSTPPSDEPSVECPAEVTTLICDPLSDQVLLRLPGAVVLPVGTLIDLPGDQVGRVASLRLDAVDAARPNLIVQVVRSHRAGSARR